MRQKRLEVWIIVILLVGSLLLGLWFYRPRTGTAIAVIAVDGKEYTRIDLSRATDETFTLPDKPVSFEIQDGKIRFVFVTCPDHICEQAGWCARPGERAVCMPNRTSLICYAPDEL